jgi:hypothetical protein
VEVVETITRAGWPPVFAYVYDELWTLWQTVPVVQILRAALGDCYKWIPHGWCHYVRPVRGASGWPPHIDGNLPNRISIWIPLTDATLDNGCVYLVPKDMNDAGIGERRELRYASNLQMRQLLQRGMALPAPAGSLLGWEFRVLHWARRRSIPQIRGSVWYSSLSGPTKRRSETRGRSTILRTLCRISDRGCIRSDALFASTCVMNCECTDTPSLPPASWIYLQPPLTAAHSCWGKWEGDLGSDARSAAIISGTRRKLERSSGRENNAAGTESTIRRVK